MLRNCVNSSMTEHKKKSEPTKFVGVSTHLPDGLKFQRATGRTCEPALSAVASALSALACIVGARQSVPLVLLRPGATIGQRQRRVHVAMEPTGAHCRQRPEGSPVQQVHTK